MRVEFEKIGDVRTPEYGTDGSAGLDFFVPNDTTWESITIASHRGINIPSGIKMKVPQDHAMIAFNKSGIALKGFQVGACVVDSDYRGEIHLHVFNTTTHDIIIKRGMKLVQFILIPYIKIEAQPVDNIESDTPRGTGGFGSTGK